MTALIRTTALDGFAPLVRELGGDPAALLRQQQIVPEQLGEAGAMLPYRSLVALLERCAQSLACEDFGLRLAQRQSPRILGPLAVLAEHAQSVGEAIELLCHFLHLYTPAVRVHLEHADEPQPQLVYELLLPGVAHQQQIVQLSLGVMLQTLRLLLGEAFHPQAVLLRGTPSLAPVRYRKAFGAPLRSGQPCNALVLQREQLQRPLTGADHLVHDALLAYLRSQDDGPQASLRQRVEECMRTLLVTRRCSLALVAERLGMQPRTLQRHLAQQAPPFEELLDALRRELADQYLANPHIPLGQAAALLGYAEQSSFIRACRRWHGLSPRARRRALKVTQSTL